LEGDKTMKEKHSIILIELDEQTREKQYNEVEKWLEHVLTVQVAFQSLAEKTVQEISEPHIREALEKLLEATKHHTKCAEKLFGTIERKADEVKDRVLGKSISAVEDALMTFQDSLGGSVGSWQGLHHLLAMNLKAMGAFAVAEQLGLSLGNKELALESFPIVHEKTMHQLLLQEYMLEMAPISILYKENA
jgi:hypothetical protein